ncbi:MAG: sulfatase [Candidatus Hydrogenedentes bacterium]|nr:sulfatase [Candidatus Hydrogenedentota bacterium]
MDKITRRSFVAQTAAGAATASAIAHARPAERRPNVLWITCEDMSPHLGCYGDSYANTPNLDAFAREGLRYTHAFSVSGVCAPSRSCLITGMYPTTLGTCHMRCDNTPPDHVRCFPAYLRRAGYYCTNNVKTDYNFAVPRDAWDANSKDAHWRNRKDPDQPFFAVFNSTVTHESQIGNLNSIPKALEARIPGGLHDPAKAALPPFYPDTELIRKHWAHMYDCVSAMDVWAGDLLTQLKEDGLAENTVVFFFGDHGDGIPRAKRWMYDSGLRVPLLVRWPKHLRPETTTDRLVSFVDFAPTVLSLAGVNQPEHMQGSAFLGKHEGKPRKYIYAARDRMDERYDIIRAVRDKRYKYIRNYEPTKPYDQYLSYCESWPIMQELRRVEAANGLDENQKLFFRDTKPVEEFFDTENDPYELHNLADDPTHARKLSELRKAMDAWLDEESDLGLVPESELHRFLPAAQPDLRDNNHPEYDTPNGVIVSVFGSELNDYIHDLNGPKKLLRYRAIASIAIAGPTAANTLLAALTDSDVCVAYWAALGLANLRTANAATLDALTAALDHDSVTVRVAAARALAELGAPDRAIPVALRAMDEPNVFVRLAACQVLERIDPKTDTMLAALRAASENPEDPRNYPSRVARHALGLPAVRR